MSKAKNVASNATIIAVTFHGKKGEFIPGVPRRDLTQEMWDLIPSQARKTALGSGLYKIVADKGDKEGK